jgi:hypothetical protein
MEFVTARCYSVTQETQSITVIIFSKGGKLDYFIDLEGLLQEL